MAQEERKLKQLDFIQLTITRMAANSFLLKAWAVTLIAGIFALAAKDSNQQFFLVAYIPVIMFWGLDAYYLYQERLFRKLYDDVRTKADQDVDLSLDISSFRTRGGWLSAVTSPTLLVFYLTLAAAIVITLFAGR
jgi:hypothetical protein